MGATVIDSLVVELGLDPKKFTDGQREALENFKRTQEEAEKGAKTTEDAGRRVGQTVSAIRTAGLQMFAAFTGGKGLVDFATGLTHSNAQLGRLERNIGVSAQTIAKWSGAAQIFGGDAKSMATSFVSMSDAFAGWQIGIPSPLIADLRAISTAGGKIIDVNKGVDQSFLDLADNLKAIHDRDPAQAGLLGRRIGLDPALFDILIRGSAGAKEVLDYVRRIGLATKEDIDEFGELEKRMAQMGLKAESLGRKLLGGKNGGASQIMQTADFLNKSPGEAWKSASEQFNAEREKSGFFGAWYNLISGNTSTGNNGSQRLFNNSGGGKGAFASPAEKEAFIRVEAVRRGIDPNVAVAVSKSEGFNNYVGDKGTSFGAFQLHYKNNIPGLSNSGLGDVFTKQTGFDARDPATERRQIQFALDQAKSGGRGWAPWHGWKGAQFAGIGQGGGNGSSSTEINIDKIEINAGANADGAKIGQDLRAELQKRQSAAAQANDGQN